MTMTPTNMNGSEPSAGVPASGASVMPSAPTAGLDQLRPDEWLEEDYQKIGLGQRHLGIGTEVFDGVRHLQRVTMTPLMQRLEQQEREIQALKAAQHTQVQPVPPAQPVNFFAQMNQHIPGYGQLILSPDCLAWRAQTPQFQQAMLQGDASTAVALLGQFLDTMRAHGYQWTVAANGQYDWAPIQSAPMHPAVPGGALNQSVLRPSVPVIPPNGGAPTYTQSQYTAMLDKSILRPREMTQQDKQILADMKLANQQGRIVAG